MKAHETTLGFLYYEKIVKKNTQLAHNRLILLHIDLGCGYTNLHFLSPRAHVNPIRGMCQYDWSEHSTHCRDMVANKHACTCAQCENIWRCIPCSQQPVTSQSLPGLGERLSSGSCLNSGSCCDSGLKSGSCCIDRDKLGGLSQPFQNLAK
jgi:hypothetical protein